MSDAVLVERRGRILVITINRPQARNAINHEVSQSLADAMDELDDSPELSVAILTGAGGNFCAGMDLKAFAAGESVAIEGRGLGFTQKPPAKPVIAAVEGYALAGGTELVLATDLVVASKSAKFGIPEVKRGLVAGAGGLLRLPKKIPYQKALELALAERITENGPLAVAVTKRIIAESESWSDDEKWDRQGRLLAPVFTSKDAIEGARAFAEKRKPEWSGA
jgi:enoyl-CoA hydratase